MGGTHPESGTFRPVQTLSAFNGESPLGEWNLTIGDSVEGSPLCHSSFSLTVEAEAPPSSTPTYTFVGFTAPVENPNVLNIAKAGQTIPLKWRLLDGSGNPVSTLSSSAVSVTVANYTCGLSTSGDQVEEYAAGKSGLQNLGNGYYQYNWATPRSYANSCKTMTLALEGTGLAPQALFRFTR